MWYRNWVTIREDIATVRDDLVTDIAVTSENVRRGVIVGGIESVAYHTALTSRPAPRCCQRTVAR